MKLTAKSTKLSTKITIILSILLICIIATVSSITYIESKREIQNEIDNKLSLILNATNKYIGSYIEHSSIALKTLASDSEILKISDELHLKNEENVERLRKRFKSLVISNEGLYSVYLGVGEKQFVSFPYRTVFNTYRNTEQEWYNKTIKNGNLTHSEPYNIGKKSIITISYPIKSNNKIIGVLAMDIDFSYISSRIGEFKVGNKDLIGIIIERDSKFIFQYVNNEDLKSAIQEKYISGDEALLTSNIYLPELSSYLNNTLEEKTIKLDINNQSFFAKVKKDNQYKWHTILGVDEANFLSSTKSLLSKIILSAIITSIISILIIAKTMKNIGDNINGLRNVVEKVEDGDLKVRCDDTIIYRTDELGRLGLGINNMIQKQMELFESLSNLMMSDPLTKLKNRRAVDEYINSIKDSASSVSVIMMDVDHFKLYNDNYGHAKGDEILKIFGQILSNELDTLNKIESKIIARYGGEEFVIIAKDCDKNLITQIGEEIKARLREKNIPHEYSLTATHVAASIGLATSNNNDVSVYDLIKFADKALYESKETGRNRYTHYSDIEDKYKTH